MDSKQVSSATSSQHRHDDARRADMSRRMTLSLHVWTLSLDFVALSAHVVLEDQALSRTRTAPVELGPEAGFEAGDAPTPSLRSPLASWAFDGRQRPMREAARFL